jgi:hypothetical protein
MLLKLNTWRETIYIILHSEISLTYLRSAQFDAHMQPKAYPNLTDEESIRLVCAPLPSVDD